MSQENLDRIFASQVGDSGASKSACVALLHTIYSSDHFTEIATEGQEGSTDTQPLVISKLVDSLPRLAEMLSTQDERELHAQFGLNVPFFGEHRLKICELISAALRLEMTVSIGQSMTLLS